MEEEFIADEEVRMYERRMDPARRSVRWSLAAVAAAFVLIGGAYAFGRLGGGDNFAASLFGSAGEEQGETFPLWSAGRESGTSFAQNAENHGTSVSAECGFESGGAVKGGAVLISEIAWMGTEAGAQYEWIELANPPAGGQAEPVNIGGWSMADKDEQIQVKFPKGTTISAGGFFLLARSAGTVGNVRADVRYTGNLKNDNEVLRLFDGQCSVIDEVNAAPKWPAGESSERRTMERNLATKRWYTSSKAGGTPKAPNSLNASQSEASGEHFMPQNVLAASTTASSTVAASAPTSTTPEASVPAPSAQGVVVISEVMAGDVGASNWDFVELRNPNSFAVDLTGWSIKKKSSTGTESALVATNRLEGKTIPGGGYLLLAHPDYAGSPAADVVWPKSYTLAYTSNAVVLYNANGEKVSEISWAEIPKGQSYARVDDVFVLGMPTPRVAP